jgi:dihydropteroate synthase
VVRVFPAVGPGETRERLAFLGAAGEGLEAFLRELRALVVAVPTGRGADARERDSRLGSLLDAKGIPNTRGGSHLLLSVSSDAQIDALPAVSPEAAPILGPVSIAIKRYLTLSFKVPVPGGYLDLSGPPLLMGILNVTPDSFSDGGTYRSAEDAVDRGFAMAAEGAAILDVGGESTRPGSMPVPLDEELRRVLPVIRGLAGRPGVIVSVDTTKADVAREAISAGAGIVNDTSALADDPAMASVVRESGCALVLMHRRGTPATMQSAPRYDSLFDEMLAELSERIEAAVAEGIGRERILVDPGIGFGKRQADNLALHRHLPELRVLGRPVVFGPSRKAFIGALTGSPAAHRQFGTAAAVAAAVLSGAHILRVHDVKEMREVVQVAAAIRGAAQC